MPRIPIELAFVIVALLVMTVVHFYCGDAVTICGCLGG